MNTRLLMSASSIFMGIAGLCLTFLPAEVIKYADRTPGELSILTLQITGALFVAFASLNWMAKGNLIGGIYSRPVAMGNFAHFFIGGITLLKSAIANDFMIVLWIAAVIYSLFAVLFALVAFGNPLRDKGEQSA